MVRFNLETILLFDCLETCSIVLPLFQQYFVEDFIALDHFNKNKFHFD